MKGIKEARKGIIVILAILLITAVASAANLSEGFEGGDIPDTWTIHNIDGGDEWEAYDAWTTHTGDWVAQIRYDTPNDDWLITPKLRPEAGNSNISFWYRSTHASWLDSFNVKLSNTSTDVSDFTVTLDSFVDVPNNWTEYTGDMSAYIGEEVYIAVQCISDNQYFFYVDDFSGPTESPVPMSLESLAVNQASTSFVSPGSDDNSILRLDFEVKGNSGTLVLNSIEVEPQNTDNSDVISVTLYRTNTTEFSTDTQLGTAQGFSSPAVFDTLDYDLPAGTTYVWVTYDVASDATLSNTLDAKILADKVDVNGSTYPAIDEDPAGSRDIARVVEIGNGTGTEHNVPFDGMYDYGWSKVIYLQSEIGDAITINKIAYDVSNTPSGYAVNDQKIYMAHTTDDVFADGSRPDNSTMTKVYEGNITWDGSGWHTITLDTPFSYNNADNLIIYYENWDGSYIFSGYPYWHYTSQSDRAAYKHSDYSFPGDASSASNKVPNIQLHYTVPIPDTTAPVVNTVTLSNTTPNTGDAILVTVNATDNVAVTGVTANGFGLADQGGNIWTGTITAIEGTHPVNVSAEDAAGKTGWNNSTGYTATTPPASPEWNETYGGSGNEYGYTVQQTSDGGYVIGAKTKSYGAGDEDFWLIKTDSEGNKEWAETYGGEGRDWTHEAIQTSDGGYAIVGDTWTYVGGTPCVTNMDAWLVKASSDGTEEWNNTYGTDDIQDYGRSVRQTSDGGYIIAGMTRAHNLPEFDYDGWLIKTDSLGKETWNGTYNVTALYDELRSVRQTSDGGYIAGGYVNKGSESTSWDFWMVKTDAAGNEEWSKTFGGDAREQAYEVKQTPDGGYIIVGKTKSYGAGGYDVWLVKTYSNGTLEWDKTYGGTETDYGYSVNATSDGGYIVTGETKSYGAGGYDVWLVKTDSGGNEEWSTTYGGTGSDYGRSVQQTDSYIIAGYTTSSGAGSKDVWLIHTEPEIGCVANPGTSEAGTIYKCGDLVNCSCTFNGNRVCPGRGLIVNSDGIVIDGAGYKIAGSVTGTDCELCGVTDPCTVSGIYNAGYDNVVIKNLEIEGFCTGISLKGTVADTVRDITIDNCRIHDNGLDTGIEIGTHGIHACYIDAGEGGEPALTITNNDIYNNEGTGSSCGSGGNGIFIIAGGPKSKQEKAVISHNNLYDNAKAGFWTKMQLSQSEITYNEIWGNGNGTGIEDDARGGIVLRCKNSNQNNISHNNIHDHVAAGYGYGIYVGGNNNTIEYNTVTNNSKHGISMMRSDGSWDNLLYENTVCDNGVDISTFGPTSGTTGDDNTCDTTSDYDDTGTTGCTYSCTAEQPYYCDVDEDGYFSAIPTGYATEVPPGCQWDVGDDCDDTMNGVNPGAAENCTDGIDNDCNGLIDGDDPACTVYANNVYLMPPHSGAAYGETATVEVYADTTDSIQGGQFYLAYSDRCANITGVTFEPTWLYTTKDLTTYPGAVFATFRKDLPMVNGTQHICTLTIQCENPYYCTGPLDFQLDGVAPTAKGSKLYNDLGAPLPDQGWHDGTFTCVDPNLPDLVITDVYGIQQGTGDDYVVTYTVENIGNAPAAADHDTTLYIDGGAIEHKAVPVSLAPGESYTETFDTVLTMTAPNDLVKACADNYGEVMELDETNNCMEDYYPAGGARVNVHVPDYSPLVVPSPGTVEVPIILGNITNYGAATINLEYDPSVVHVTGVTGSPDSIVTANHIDNTNGIVNISALNIDGASGSIVFANVMFGNVSGSSIGECSNLTLTVDTLQDIGYQDLPYYTTDGEVCLVEDAPPVVSVPTASPDTILNDNGRGRAPWTGCSILSVTVQDDTDVASVTIDLSSIRGAGYEAVQMAYHGPTDTWMVETNATLDAGVDQTHDLVVTATDDFGNSNADECVTLTVLRRGDAYRNNRVDMGDALRIARWTVGLDTEPNPLVSDVVSAEVNNKVDMGDALYIARYTVGLETAP